MIELRNVWRNYSVGMTEVVALRDVSAKIGDGEFVAIVGPSGSGKSTLLHIIGLLDRPSRGSVLLDGQEVARLSDKERTRLRLMHLGFVFQRFHLLGNLSAIENVTLPMEALGVPLAARYTRAAALLGSVGLSNRMSFRPGQLSGGQRQRVAIARALANEPQILLADEPTGELHSADRAAVVALLQSAQQQGKTVVVVTHDPEVAAAAERRIELRDGASHDVPKVAGLSL